MESVWASFKKKKKRDFSFCDFSHSFTLYIRFIHKSFPHGLKRETFIQNRWFAIQKILVEELEVLAHFLTALT